MARKAFSTVSSLETSAFPGLDGLGRTGLAGDKAITALGLGEARQARGPKPGQSPGQGKEAFDGTVLEFEFRLEKRLRALPGTDLAGIQRAFDHRAVRTGKHPFRAGHRGLENRIQGGAIEKPPEPFAQLGIVDAREIRNGTGHRHLMLARGGQAPDHAGRRLDRLHPGAACLAHAQGPARRLEGKVRRVEIDRLQLSGHRTGDGETRGRRGLLQALEGGAVGLELQLDLAGGRRGALGARRRVLVHAFR